MADLQGDVADGPFATLNLRHVVFGLDLHPSRPLCAAGLLSGQLKLFEYDVAGRSVAQTWSARPHKESCRSVRFSADGASVFSAGVDGTLQQRDLETNQPTWRMRHAATTGINALTLLGDVGIATGDDEGGVRCWDLRQRAASMAFKENEDYVADLLYATNRKSDHTLVVAGGDGLLSVFDLRAGRLWARSDPQEDELLSLALVKNGRKLLGGMQTGCIGIFSWGDFGDVSDRLLGHPASVDCMAAHGEDAIITGGGDGLLRFVSVHPNKVLGVVGEHGDSPIETLALDGDGSVLASCAHDQTLKLWDVAYLHGGDDEEDGDGSGEAESDDESNDDGDDDASDGGSHRAAKAARREQQVKPIVKQNAAIKLGAGFFAGL